MGRGTQDFGSGVGHGGLGLRDNILTFEEFQRQTDNEKHLYLDFQIAKAAGTGWVLNGTRYERAWAEFADGLMADVVAVETENEVLRFVEDAATVSSTEGTWTYNSLRAMPPNYWDGGFQFDVGQTWDAPLLSCHLTGGGNPDALTIGVWHGVYYSNAGIVLPSFGPERFSNTDLESWINPTNPTFFSAITTGGMSIDQDLSQFYNGVTSARFSGAAAAADTTFLRATGITLRPEWIYSYSGAYRTSYDNDPGFRAMISVNESGTGGTGFLQADGFTPSSNASLTLTNTGGEWRRFLFHFQTSPTATGAGRFRFGMVNTDGGSTQSGQVWFDDVHMRPVRRFNNYLPRLLPGGAPRISMGSQGVFFGDKRVGAAGTFRFGNSASHWERVLGGTWEPLGGRTSIRGGGIFRGGTILPMEDTVPIGVGIVRETEVGDAEVTITTEDPATIFDTLLPFEAYGILTEPDGEERDRGRWKPFLWGFKEGIRPSRVARDATTGLGIYEIASPAIAADPAQVLFSFGGGVENCFAYTSEAAADAEDADERIDLANTTDYTVSITTARLNLVRNPGPIKIVEGENDRLDYTFNVTTREIAIPPALYTLRTLVLFLNGATAADALTWTYNESSGGVPEHLMKCGYAGAGNLTFLASTGVNKGRSVLPTIGFTGSANVVTASGNTATADTAMFSDADKIVLRINANGYKDDSLGTFTGTAHGRIFKAGDVFMHLWIKGFKRGIDEIGTTFVTARNTAFQQLAIYLGALASVQDGQSGQVTFGKVVQALETGAVGDFQCDGNGVWQFVVRQGGLAGIAIGDNQFKRDPSFKVRRRLDEAYGRTRVLFQQNPSTARVRSVEVKQAYTTTILRRPQPRNFLTYLESETDALEILGRIAALTVSAIRHPIFGVKGYLLNKRPGDVAVLTRAQGQGAPSAPDPVLNAVSFRLLAMSIDYLSHDVTAEAHTNISPA